MIEGVDRDAGGDARAASDHDAGAPSVDAHADVEARALAERHRPVDERVGRDARPWADPNLAMRLGEDASALRDERGLVDLDLLELTKRRVHLVLPGTRPHLELSARAEVEVRHVLHAALVLRPTTRGEIRRGVAHRVVACAGAAPAAGAASAPWAART